MLQINASVVENLTKKLQAMKAEVNYDKKAWTDFGQSIGGALQQGILFGSSWTNIMESIGSTS